MKIRYLIKRLLFITLLVSLSGVFFANASHSMSESNLINQLEGLSPHQALALANQWHWERQPVRTHITSKELVFEFEGGTVKKIPLPNEQMMVAVAPYVKTTHK